jgi:hypothetical protein
MHAACPPRENQTNALSDTRVYVPWQHAAGSVPVIPAQESEMEQYFFMKARASVHASMASDKGLKFSL